MSIRDRDEWLTLREWIVGYKNTNRLSYRQLLEHMGLEVDGSFVTLIGNGSVGRVPSLVEGSYGMRMREAIVRLMESDLPPPKPWSLGVRDVVEELVLDRHWLYSRKIRVLKVLEDGKVFAEVWSDYDHPKLVKDIGDIWEVSPFVSPCEVSLRDSSSCACNTLLIRERYTLDLHMVQSE